MLLSGSHCVLCGGTPEGRRSALFRMVYDIAAEGKTVAFCTPSRERIEENPPNEKLRLASESSFEMDRKVLKRIKMSYRPDAAELAKWMENTHTADFALHAVVIDGYFDT